MINIFFLVLTWECHHEIKVLGMNPKPGPKSSDEKKVWDTCSWSGKGMQNSDGTDLQWNTSVGEGVRVWYIVVHHKGICTEGSSWSRVWCKVENYEYASKDNPWFLKIDYSQKVTEHQEQMYKW